MKCGDWVCIGIFARGVHYESGAIDEFRGCRHEEQFEIGPLLFGDTHGGIIGWPGESAVN
jgi:hypothetical protein